MVSLKVTRHFKVVFQTIVQIENRRRVDILFPLQDVRRARIVAVIARAHNAQLYLNACHGSMLRPIDQ